jgi:hypothetical protein
MTGISAVAASHHSDANQSAETYRASWVRGGGRRSAPVARVHGQQPPEDEQVDRDDREDERGRPRREDAVAPRARRDDEQQDDLRGGEDLVLHRHEDRSAEAGEDAVLKVEDAPRHRRRDEPRQEPRGEEESEMR